ncbi:hypothetical protein MTP99_015863 [Tenebrio molitor]|jgi:transposase|nr:hypothetical protein MTP99_015863 [Tenebrio molitor]
MPQVSKFDKTRVVTLFQTGLTCNQISTRLGIPKSTISFIIRRWRRTGTVARAQESGRPKVSTGRQDESFLDTLRNHLFSTAQEAVNRTQFPGSITTALRRVRGSEISSRAAARKTYSLLSIKKQGWDLPSNTCTKTKFLEQSSIQRREGIPVLLQRTYKGIPTKELQI